MLIMNRLFTKESALGVAERSKGLANASWMSKATTMMTRMNSYECYGRVRFIGHFVSMLPVVSCTHPHFLKLPQVMPQYCVD